MLEDIKSEPISNYELTPQQKQEAQQLYSQYLEQNPNGNIEGFKNWVDNSERQYSKKENKVKPLADRKGVTYNDINNIDVFC